MYTYSLCVCAYSFFAFSQFFYFLFQFFFFSLVCFFVAFSFCFVLLLFHYLKRSHHFLRNKSVSRMNQRYNISESWSRRNGSYHCYRRRRRHLMLLAAVYFGVSTRAKGTHINCRVITPFWNTSSMNFSQNMPRYNRFISGMENVMRRISGNGFCESVKNP